MLQTWKQRSGSKGTYKKLIRIFEHAGYKRYADGVRMIAQDSDSETDDSSGSGEEHSPVEQPPTYPSFTLQNLMIPQSSSIRPEATETYVVVSEADTGILTEGKH